MGTCPLGLIVQAEGGKGKGKQGKRGERRREKGKWRMMNDEWGIRYSKTKGETNNPTQPHPPPAGAPSLNPADLEWGEKTVFDPRIEKETNSPLNISRGSMAALQMKLPIWRGRQAAGGGFS